MLQVNGKLDASFADPLALMSGCHRRIEHFLAMLGKVVDGSDGGPLAEMERDALDVSLRYFAGMAPKHTADEEESLFPRLRHALAAADGGDTQGIVSLMAGLASDHEKADAAHAEVESLGRRWLDEGKLGPVDLARLRELLGKLRATYAAHIELEDQTLFPAASDLLDDRAIAAIGMEMSQRREHLTCSQRKAGERAG